MPILGRNQRACSRFRNNLIETTNACIDLKILRDKVIRVCNAQVPACTPIFSLCIETVKRQSEALYLTWCRIGSSPSIRKAPELFFISTFTNTYRIYLNTLSVCLLCHRESLVRSLCFPIRDEHYLFAPYLVANNVDRTCKTCCNDRTT